MLGARNSCARGGQGRGDPGGGYALVGAGGLVRACSITSSNHIHLSAIRWGFNEGWGGGWGRLMRPCYMEMGFNVPLGTEEVYIRDKEEADAGW